MQRNRLPFFAVCESVLIRIQDHDIALCERHFQQSNSSDIFRNIRIVTSDSPNPIFGVSEIGALRVFVTKKRIFSQFLCIEFSGFA